MPTVLAEDRREVTINLLEALIQDNGRVYAAKISPGLWQCECTSPDWQFHGNNIMLVCDHLKAALADMGKA